jgi:hypothetical protein
MPDHSVTNRLVKHPHAPFGETAALRFAITPDLLCALKLSLHFAQIELRTSTNKRCTGFRSTGAIDSLLSFDLDQPDTRIGVAHPYPN